MSAEPRDMENALVSRVKTDDEPPIRAEDTLADPRGTDREFPQTGLQCIDLLGELLDHSRIFVVVARLCRKLVTTTQQQPTGLGPEV